MTDASILSSPSLLPFERVRELHIGEAELLTQESPGTLLALALPARAGADRLREADTSWETVGFVLANQYMRDFFLKPKLRGSFERMIDGELRHPGFWQQNHDGVYAALERTYVADCFALFREDFSRLSVRDLQQRFIALYRQSYVLELWGLRQEEVILCTDELVATYQQKDPSLAASMREYLLAPRLNYLQQHDLALAEIGIKGVSLPALREHAQRFFWLRSNYVHASDLSAHDFRSMLLEMGETPEALRAHVAHIRALVDGIAQEQTRLWPQIRAAVDERTCAALRIGNSYAVWREQRKHQNLLWFAVLQRFIDLFVARFGEEEHRVRSLLPEEFLHAFEDVSVLSVSDARVAGVAGVWNEGKEGIYTGSDYQEILQAYEKAITVEAAQELSGLQAASGVAEGPVMIIRDPMKDVFPAGSVLVTSMTRPEFVPLMKRAVAVITDEGGMLSHAAIISRELGIPCVVGTKHATRALRSGQRVRVDGGTGHVNVIG